jgi:hypothetical protein
MVNFYLEDNHFVFELNNENNDLQRFYTPEYFEFLGIDIEIFSNNIPKMNGGSAFEGTELTIPYKYFANFIDGNMKFIPDTEQKEPTVYETGNYMDSIENDKMSIVEEEPEVETPDEEEPYEEESYEEKSYEKKPDEEESVEEEPDEEEPDEEESDEEESDEEESDEEESDEEESDEEESDEENVVSVKNILMLKIEINDDNKSMNGSLKDIMTSNKEKNGDNIQLNSDGLFYEDIERIYVIKKYINTDVFQDEVFRINGKFIVLKENLSEPTENISGLDVSMMENTVLTNKLRT